MFGSDGTCPACRRPQSEGVRDEAEPAEAGAFEVGWTRVQLAPLPVERSAAPKGYDESLRELVSVLAHVSPMLPSSCACCGTREGVRQIQAPGDGGIPTAIPSCAECVRHLTPTSFQPAFWAAVGLGALGGLGWRASSSPVAAAVLGLGLVGVVVSMVLDRRSAANHKPWREPRNGHAGPLRLIRMGPIYVFQSQHRSWLEKLAAANQLRMQVHIEQREESPSKARGEDGPSRT